MKSYVINLDTRPDRMALFHAEAEKAEMNYERIRATTPKDCIVPRSFKLPPASYANGQSHKRIWQLLIDSGDEYACIFEDDAVYNGKIPFNAEFALQIALRSIGIDKLHMLFLGGNHSEHGAEQGTHINGHLYRCKHTLTGHAYIIHRDTAKWLIDNVPFATHAIDAGWKWLHDQGNSYYYEPSIWVQRPDFSDIWGRHVDYSSCIK